jgi:hypothetical protein
MKTLFTLFFFVSLQSFTFIQSSYDGGKESCDSKNIEIVNDVNFKFDIENSKIVGIETIKKRAGISSFYQLTQKEQKSILKKAAKFKSCKIVCDFEYETPKQLKNFNIEKENNKMNYFHFYFVQETKK